MAESGLGDIAQVHEAPDDLLAAIDYCYEQGWTDGLPVVPLEASRVESMMSTDGRSPAPGGIIKALAQACDFLLTAMGD